MYFKGMLRILLVLLLWVMPAAAAMRCDGCGKAITGSYLSALGKSYHPEHFVCGACHRPLGERYFPKDGVPYHYECHLKLFAIKCTICREPIESTYISDYWGNRFHDYHLNSYPFCHFCRRPITQNQSKGGYRLSDGRILCGYCADHAVLNQKQADKYAKEARDLMAKWGLKLPKLPVVLVSRQELESSSGPNVLGLTRSMARGNTRTIQQISMCYGLPRQVFMGTMIHEYTHAWLFLNTGKLHRSLELEEGLCNFVAYLYHLYSGEAAANYFVKQLDENPDRIYGEGFRRVKAYASTYGSDAAVRQLGLAEDFPAGY